MSSTGTRLIAGLLPSIWNVFTTWCCSKTQTFCSRVWHSRMHYFSKCKRFLPVTCEMILGSIHIYFVLNSYKLILVEKYLE